MLGDPWTKPEFTLTDVNGQPFDFRAGTDGYLTLLFFGYTHCPDVCPLHMANLAAVLDALPGDVRVNTKVVFATTDPARDTPAVLKKWLGNFDPTFIGLTGTADEMAAAQRAAGIPVSVAEPPKADGSYLVGHAAQVIAYTRDGLAHVVYPFGTRQSRLGRRPPPPAHRAGLEPHRMTSPRRRVGSLRRAMTRSTDPTVARRTVVGRAVVLGDRAWSAAGRGGRPARGTATPSGAPRHHRHVGRRQRGRRRRRRLPHDQEHGRPRRRSWASTDRRRRRHHPPHRASGAAPRRWTRRRRSPSAAARPCGSHPGGTHLMLEPLRRPLQPGDQVTLTLQFRRSVAVDGDG